MHYKRLKRLPKRVVRNLKNKTNWGKSQLNRNGKTCRDGDGEKKLELCRASGGEIIYFMAIC